MRIGMTEMKAFARLLTSNYDDQGCDYNTVLVRMLERTSAR